MMRIYLVTASPELDIPQTPLSASIFTLYSTSAPIHQQHRIAQPVLVLMQAIWLRRIARVWIDRREFALSGTIPPRTQVDEPGGRILQLAREAKRRHGAALGRAPGLVVDDAERRRGSVERAAHAAQRVLGVPGRGAAVQRCQPIQSIHVICRSGAADLGLKNLREWRGQILRIERGSAA